MTSSSASTCDSIPSANAEQMTIVLVTFDMHGHFRPIFAFGEQLIKFGAPNTRVVPMIPCSSSSKFPTDEFPNLEPVVRLSMPDNIHNVGLAQFEWFYNSEQQLVDEAVELLAPYNPKAICYDPFTGFAQTVADVLGVKHLALLTSPLTLNYLWCQGEIMCSSAQQKAKEGIADGPPSDKLYIPTIGFINRQDCPDSTGLGHLFDKNAEKMTSLRSVVVNSSPREPGSLDLAKAFKNQYLTPTSRHDVGDVHLLGYFGDASEDTKEASKSCATDKPLEPIAGQAATEPAKLPEIEWLDQQADNSVIFIALGSWCQLPLADVVELAEGIAGTATKFLWALRDRAPVPLRIAHAPEGYQPRACTDETESCGLPIGFRDRMAETGLILPWVRQTEVLKHPAIKLFVTHCGWNSLSEGICLSPAPKAFLPLGAEQGLNAHVGQEQWKIGKRLWGCEHDRALDRANVSRTLLDIMADEEVCGNAKRLYEEHNVYRKAGAAAGFQKLLAELAL